MSRGSRKLGSPRAWGLSGLDQDPKLKKSSFLSAPPTRGERGLCPHPRVACDWTCSSRVAGDDTRSLVEKPVAGTPFSTSTNDVAEAGFRGVTKGEDVHDSPEMSTALSTRMRRGWQGGAGGAKSPVGAARRHFWTLPSA